MAQYGLILSVSSRLRLFESPCAQTDGFSKQIKGVDHVIQWTLLEDLYSALPLTDRTRISSVFVF